MPLTRSGLGSMPSARIRSASRWSAESFIAGGKVPMETWAAAAAVILV